MKAEFTYRNIKIVLIWMLVFGAPFIWLVPDLLIWINGVTYYVINTLLTIVLVFALWRMMDSLPGIRRKGYYWKDNNITIVEYGRKRVVLNSVSELFLTDRHAASRGITLLIRNNGLKIELLSEAVDKGTSPESTVFFDIFSQILAENPNLKQEKDIYGEPIGYWYKAD